MSSSTEEKILAQNLISAASRHDLNATKNLLAKVSANVQNEANGFTPLHAAIASCEQKVTVQGSELSNIDDETAAIVQVLLENGAIWNDLDKDDETPGCIAYRIGLKKVYEMIVDAGIRAELLLSKLDVIGASDGDEDSGDETQGATNEAPLQDMSTAAVASDSKMAVAASDSSSSSPAAATVASSVATSTSVSDPNSDSSKYPPPDDYIDYWDSNASFLRSNLRYTDTTLLDHSSNAVMMDWETEIMTRHAATLLPSKGLRVMNIGHGMGIVDGAIQAHSPSEHHIVEAHPEVLEQMRKKGWFEKPGVIIHQGRWQDVLPKLVEQGVVLDAIYYDTFAEDYKDLRELFSEHVIGLMEQDGRFGFYNGMGADRRVCYDVYTGVVEIDLSEAGFKAEWENIPVPKVDWKGVRRPYWNVDVYRLPTCTFI